MPTLDEVFDRIEALSAGTSVTFELAAEAVRRDRSER